MLSETRINDDIDALRDSVQKFAAAELAPRAAANSCDKLVYEALRAAMRPPLLSATEARSSLPEPAFAATVVACRKPPLLA